MKATIFIRYFVTKSAKPLDSVILIHCLDNRCEAMLPVIAISGTPGTGKTIVAQLLAKELDVSFIELTQLIKKHNLHSGRDSKRDSLIANIDKLQQHLVSQYRNAKERVIIVGHFADEVPVSLLEILVVLRCHPVILIQRLRKRNWSEEKIVENVQAEILGESTAQGLSRHAPSKIFEIDTTDSSVEEVIENIKKIMTDNRAQYSAGNISWLQVLDPELLYQIMEKNTLPSEP